MQASCEHIATASTMFDRPRGHPPSYIIEAPIVGKYYLPDQACLHTWLRSVNAMLGGCRGMQLPLAGNDNHLSSYALSLTSLS